MHVREPAEHRVIAVLDWRTCITSSSGCSYIDENNNNNDDDDDDDGDDNDDRHTATYVDDDKFANACTNEFTSFASIRDKHVCVDGDGFSRHRCNNHNFVTNGDNQF
jgi:hypothetical protein